MTNVEDRIGFLREELHRALAAPIIMFHSVCDINSQGLYLIYQNEKIIYIGKTSRFGKTRLRELASDFRSHTLNKKLLSEHLRSSGIEIGVMTKESKLQLINDGIVTLDEFKEHQTQVNNKIKSEFKFRFFSVGNEKELTDLEHFAISVFSPRYND
jgi:hypothetical protein